jgi:hypothetical protein
MKFLASVGDGAWVSEESSRQLIEGRYWLTSRIAFERQISNLPMQTFSLCFSFRTSLRLPKCYPQMQLRDAEIMSSQQIAISFRAAWGYVALNDAEVCHCLRSIAILRFQMSNFNLC